MRFFVPLTGVNVKTPLPSITKLQMEKSGLPERRKSGVRAICVNDIVREESGTAKRKKTSTRRRLEKNPAFFKPGTKKPLNVEKMIPAPAKPPKDPLPAPPPAPQDVLAGLLEKAAAALPRRSASA